MSDEIKIIRAPCNDCGRDTDHDILKSHETSGHDENTGWSTVFQMIECRGCHFISLKRTFDFSEWDGLQIEYFPPPISRKKPVWGKSFLLNAPIELQELLNEVYSALHANNRRLGTMGARALLDIVIVNKVGDVGRFDQKLDALESNHLISKTQREFLEAALNAGNAASHQGHCPTAEGLNSVMDIVESIISQIYVLPDAAEELRKTTPVRRKTKPVEDATALPQ